MQVRMTISKQSQNGTPALNLPTPNVQEQTPDDGQRKCPKHVEFYDRIIFDKFASGWLLKRKKEIYVCVYTLLGPR
jgi:hypothetical protein